MSETVSKALKVTGGAKAAETAKFIEMVDKLFDCLNVSSLSKGKLKRKPFLQPYRNSNDFRLKVNTFLILILHFIYLCYVLNSFSVMS